MLHTDRIVQVSVAVAYGDRLWIGKVQHISHPHRGLRSGRGRDGAHRHGTDIVRLGHPHYDRHGIVVNHTFVLIQREALQPRVAIQAQVGRIVVVTSGNGRQQGRRYAELFEKVYRFHIFHRD